jgi:hypothetical protein
LRRRRRYSRRPQRLAPSRQAPRIVNTPIGFIAFLLGFELWVIVVSVVLWLRGREAAPAPA